MKIKFRYEWFNDEKTAMRYVALEDWNWRDYHACVRVSLFAMNQHPHAVDSVIDLREHTRDTMPSGLPAHMSSFGKKLTAALSGKAVVIGLSETDKAKLPLNDDGTLSTTDGAVYFVSDDAAAQAIIDRLSETDSVKGDSLTNEK